MMTTGSEISVIAVVVTRNRLRQLMVTLDAVLSQGRAPDRVVVVDNDSSDGTVDWLTEIARREPRVHPLLLGENQGGAGGFHAGIRRAFELGARWMWLLDDDCIPAEACLEELLEFERNISSVERMGFLASQVNWIDGSRHVMNQPCPAPDWSVVPEDAPGCVKIQHASFTSLLVSRGAVQAVGYPIKQFFIWRDDVEFTSRIWAAGFANYYVPGSRAVHATRSNKASEYTKVDIGDLEKWRYGVRNHVAVERFGAGKTALHAIKFLLWMNLRIARSDIPLAVKVRLVGDSITGFRFDYRRLVERPSSASPSRATCAD